MPEISHDTEAPAEARKLPNMNEFSPGTLGTNSIHAFLRGLAPYAGDREAMLNNILASCSKIANTPNETERRKRLGNVLIGMSQCGLLEKEGHRITAQFTPLAQELAAEPDEATANERFARHLLEKHHGLELLDCVAMIRARGEPPTKLNVLAELRSRGFEVTENEVNAAKIRQWLERTGVVDKNWNVDDERLHGMIGATSEILGKWRSLSRPQRTFLAQLRATPASDSDDGWVSVRQLKALCELAHGRNVFPEGQLRARVIAPLQQQGWLEARGTGGGRGGDSGDVRATAQLTDLGLTLPMDEGSRLPIELRDKLSIPLEQIFLDLESPDTHTKGLALELLALRLVRDIGLFPVCFRERSNQTQGAEVDLIANGVHLHFSRWLVQCKNTSNVHVHDIAKEVGMAVVLKAHVIAMVTTGSFGSAVRRYADGLAASSALQAVLIDGDLLRKYRQGSADSVIEWLRSTAHHVLRLKAPQVLDIQES